jgi:hypothetical protein
MNCGSLHRDIFSLPDAGADGAFLQRNGLWVPSGWVLPETIALADVGKVLQVTADDVASFETITLTATKQFQYAFGAQQVNTGTQALFPFFSTSAATTLATSATGAPAEFAGNLKTLYVTHGATAGADTLVYTVMVNGVASALTASLSSGSNGPASNLVTTVAVAAGDKLTLRVTGAAANRAVRARVQFILEVP